MLQDLLPFGVWLLELAIVSLTIAGAWRTFAKLGEPGWAVLVPIYNAVVLCRAARRDGVYAFWLCVPCTAPIMVGVVSIALAERLGRGRAFGLGLAYLPFVFYPLVGFSRGFEPRPRQREHSPGSTAASPQAAPLPASPPPLPAAPPPLPAAPPPPLPEQALTPDEQEAQAGPPRPHPFSAEAQEKERGP